MEKKYKGRLSTEQLHNAMQKESTLFEEYYLWIEKHMAPAFFEEIEQSQVMIIAHNLMGFPVQNYYSQIHFGNCSFVLCLDSPDADLRILQHYSLYGIKNYRAFISDVPPPFPDVDQKLRIATIYFTEIDQREKEEEKLTPERSKHIFKLVKERNPHLTQEEFDNLIAEMDSLFLRSLAEDRLALTLDMYFRAKTRDYCQYEVRYNEDWDKDGKENPSMQVVFAWRNAPKYRFLYRMAKTIYRHGLKLKRVNGVYSNPYKKNPILIMSLGLHGIHGKAAWEEADVDDFLQELVTLKYFDDQDKIESVFVKPALVRGNIGNFLRTTMNFVHQALVHADPNLYSIGNIEEALCRHPELTVKLCEAFEAKFHPKNHDTISYKRIRKELLELVSALDTGNEMNDTRRKNVLIQAMNCVDFTLKTNFYRNNKSGISYRLDPKYLEFVPYARKEKFPELPYAIFFIQGMHYIGFHIRFQDLSRGGLRTVLPQRIEEMVAERNNVFSECYNLAYTQEKKNKDIPEGGSKAVIFLEPYEHLHFEADIYKKELKMAGVENEEIKKRLFEFKKEEKLQYLYQTQRAFVHSLVTLVNCKEDGTLKARNVLDYWKKPEYLYLGPDENMHNEMVEWIANYSKQCHYKPGGAFISSKPKAGINHKEYGVTSLGVNVCIHEVLHYLNINPETDPFTIKISGGPDGDVAGNEMLNLFRFYPKTAKLLAVTDISGTIFDPEGLDLKIFSDFFHEAKPIRHYPPEKLHEGGFLLDTFTKREQTAYAQQTLLWKKEGGKAEQHWLSGSEMNHLLRHNLHQIKCDVFVPAGGRPRTLNEHNWKDYIDKSGQPTSKAIVEGANLYLTPIARRKLEELGTIIIKDSSANKGGVISSSFEVLFGLTLSEEEFLHEKPHLMQETLEIIREKARDEAQLLLKIHDESGDFLTDISEWVSERINTYTYQLLHHLEGKTLSNDPKDPLIRCLLGHCPKLLRTKYRDRIIENIPDIHKKAIISSYLGARTVYKKGLKWSPSIVDVLPVIAKDPDIIGSND